MLKTWEKTSCGASITVRNLDFSCWTGCSGCLPGGMGALWVVWTAWGRASASSGDEEAGGLRRLGQALSLPVLVKGQRVDHEGVPEQVHVLAGVADAVGPAQVQGVLEAAVDRLGVAPPAVDLFEIGIARGDRPDVLGPVELAGGVLVVVVEAHRDGLAAVALGKLIIVVTAEPPRAVTMPLTPIDSDGTLGTW
jgi:hypothetical protein